MPGHDIVVIGASAGGVEALSALFSLIPPDTPACFFVVLHVPDRGTSALPGILSRRSRFAVVHARDGDPVEPGRVYVAPPGSHLLVKRGRVRLVRGPRENGARPAVDPLFRTAAAAYGRRVVGVVLSGTLDDGTAGLQAVKRRGGTAVAQDPEEAMYGGMPRSAAENVAVDHVLPLAGIAALLERLAATEVQEEPGGGDVPQEMQREIDSVEMDPREMSGNDHPGTPSGYTCPECHGGLWELRDGELVRFRCRVGHAFSVETLLSEQSTAMEAALWTALMALEERASLSRGMAERMDRRGHPRLSERYRREAEETESRALVIRRVLLDGGAAGEVEQGSATSPAPTAD
ncbi:MAG TPA: chemotaxis protein CheB [Longimicrobiaceae bacterium]|nr:chemotaxis protein CheB [Longimicrobiaceae bacterium]